LCNSPRLTAETFVVAFVLQSVCGSELLMKARPSCVVQLSCSI